MGEFLSDLGILALICTLRGSEDTEWPSCDTGCPDLDLQARKALCYGPLPLPCTWSAQGAAVLPDWTSAFSFTKSLGVLAMKWRHLSGNTLNLRTTGCNRDTWKKKNHQSLLSCLCWFRFPFISLSCFPLHSLLVHCPGVKFIHFSITPSFKVAGFHPRLLNRNVYEWTWLN